MFEVFVLRSSMNTRARERDNGSRDSRRSRKWATTGGSGRHTRSDHPDSGAAGPPDRRTTIYLSINVTNPEIRDAGNPSGPHRTYLRTEQSVHSVL